MASATRPQVHVAVLHYMRCAHAEEMTSTDDPSLSASSAFSTCDLDLPSSSSTASGTVRRSMESATRPPAHVAVLRCMRCARAEEMTSTDDPSLSGMIRIGTNIYYCNRCAKMVGYM